MPRVLSCIIVSQWLLSQCLIIITIIDAPCSYVRLKLQHRFEQRLSRSYRFTHFFINCILLTNAFQSLIHWRNRWRCWGRICGVMSSYLTKLSLQWEKETLKQWIWAVVEHRREGQLSGNRCADFSEWEGADLGKTRRRGSSNLKWEKGCRIWRGWVWLGCSEQLGVGKWWGWRGRRVLRTILSY